MIKPRLARRFGLRAVTGRLPTSAGKCIDLLVTATPYIIDALTRLQHRCHHRTLPVQRQAESQTFDGNQQTPGHHSVKKPEDSPSSHRPSPGDLPDGPPVRDPSTE